MLNALFRRLPLIEEMEPRILFSADLAPFALDGLAPVSEQRTIQADGEFSSVVANTRNELVIVDTSVVDYSTLLADILNQAGNDRHFSVVILDANQDGIQQISDALKQYGNLDAVHLITHGESGTLLLGSSRLDAASLSDRASEISGWARAFTDDADLLLYGCDVASDAKGEAFLITLSQLTGADVAASSDLTGNAALGGNWVLEFNNGAIETSVVLSAAAQANWQGVLVAPVLLDTKTPLVMLVQQVTVATPFTPPSGAWGDLVSSLVDTVDGNGRDNVSDSDGPAVGIAIISANSSNGTYYYSSDNGASWTQISPTVGPANALLLPADSQTRVYFQPNQNYTGYISNALSIRAWDQSAGAAYTYADTNTAPVDGASSSGQKNISVQVTASGNNTAPTATNKDAAETYTVNTTLNLTDIVVSDTDSGNVSVTLTLSDMSAGSLTTGTSGTTTSTFSSGTWSVKGSLFDVNTLLASVSYVPTAAYASNFNITVSISDGLAAPVTGLKLMSTNNAAPVITSNGAGATASLSVSENTTFVTTVTATDVDTPTTSLVYSISGGVDAAKLTINSSSGLLQFATPPNYEAPTDFNGDNIYEVVVQVWDGSAADTQSLLVTVTDVTTVSGVASGTLLFTTATAQTSVAGGSTWDNRQVLQYGNAGDYFDINGGTTTGTVEVLLGFTAPAPVRGMHYVQTAITIGTSGTQFNLNSGDLLLVLDPGGSPATVTLNAGDANPANDFAADRQDIVVYRPSAAGNYSNGEYFMLLDNGVQNGGTIYNVHAISLVEIPTMVGGTVLPKGTFIVAHSTSAPPLHSNIYTFNAIGTGLGASTQTSNTSLLLNGAALSSSTSQIQGLHLLSEDTSFNDTKLDAGTLLVAVNGTNANYAGISQDTFDIIALLVTQTQQDAIPGTAATGKMLFDGSDLGLSSSNLNGFTVLTKTATNSAPVAVADTATAVEAGGIANGTAGTNPGGNVLTNDTDVDSGDTKTVTAFSFGATPGTLGSALAGSYGSLTLNAAGNYSYEVNNNHAAVQALRTGSNSLTETYNYTMRDTAGATSSTTLTITITGTNDAPVAVADTAGVTQNALLTRSAGSGVLSNDTDVDSSDSKQVTGVSGTAGSTSVTNLTPGVLTNTYGTLTLNEDGAYTYLANGAASWALLGGATHVETFTYTMKDTAGAASSTTLTITIMGSNDAPVAVADTATAVEAGGVANSTAGTNPGGNVLTNDTDVDSGDTKTVTAFSFGATPGTLGSALAGSYGSLTLNAAGNYSYVVDNTNTTVQALRNSGDTLTETFSYTMQDSVGAASSTTLTITITGTNDAPVAVADTTTAVEAGGVANGTAGTNPSGNVLTNDTDVDSNDAMSVTAFSFGATPGTLGSALAGSYGSLTLNATGGYSYVLDNSNAAVQALRTVSDTLTEAFNYTMQDTAGATSNTTLTITITGSNDDPVAVADTATAVEAGGVTNGTAGTNPSGNVLTNDTDADSGDSKTVTAVSFGVTPGLVGLALAGSYGSLTLNADGSYNYVVDNNNATVQALRPSSSPLVEIFDYTMQDTAGVASSTTLTITITGANDAPVITSGNTYAVIEDQPASVTVTATDVESDTLSYSISGGADALLFTINASTGVLSLIMVPNYEAPQDANLDNIYEVTITVSDGNGGVATLAIQLVVIDKPEPVPPTPPSVTPPPSTDSSTADKDTQDEIKLIAIAVTAENANIQAASNLADHTPVLTLEYQNNSTVGQFQLAFNSDLSNRNVTSTTTLLAALNHSLSAMASDARALQMLQSSFGNINFQQQLDQLQDTIRQHLSLDRSTIASTLAISTGLSVGYVFWLVRGGVLLSSLLTSLPAWRLIDPLPILGHLGTRKAGENDDDDESLEGMLNKSNTRTEPTLKSIDEVAP